MCTFWSSRRVPVFLSRFNKFWILWTDFRKFEYKISLKTVQWEPRWAMRTGWTKRRDGLADGQTHMTKLYSRFSILRTRLKRHKRRALVRFSCVLLFLPLLLHSVFPYSVFSSSFFVKIVILILIFLSFSTSTFFLISPLPSIFFPSYFIILSFSFHFSSNYRGAIFLLTLSVIQYRKMFSSLLSQIMALWGLKFSQRWCQILSSFGKLHRIEWYILRTFERAHYLQLQVQSGVPFPLYLAMQYTFLFRQGYYSWSFLYIFVSLCLHTHTHTHTHTRTRTRIYIYIYIYTHARHVSFWAPVNAVCSYMMWQIFSFLSLQSFAFSYFS